MARRSGLVAADWSWRGRRRAVIEMAGRIGQTATGAALGRCGRLICSLNRLGTMRLHCLGTAGYHPGESRHTSCYVLPEAGIVLDAGSGMFRLEGLIETPTLDILLSHAHLDHTIGLTFLVGILYRRPVERLRIWGSRDKLDAVRRHLFSELLFPVALQAEWMPLEDHPGPVEIGSAKVSWRPQEHPGGSLAYRLDWPASNRSLVYATDTPGDTSEGSVAWMRGADLLMHECFFGDAHRGWAEKTGHSWSGRVAEIAAAAEPAQLLITHLHPGDGSIGESERAEIARGLAGSVVWAADKLVVEF